MAKLIFEYAEILTSAGASQGTPEFIKNITVEGVEVGLEPDTVNVEDNREIYESYTGRIVIRSKDTNFTQVGGSGATTAILDSSLVSTDGTVPTEGRLRLHKITSNKLAVMEAFDPSDHGEQLTIWTIWSIEALVSVGT